MTLWECMDKYLTHIKEGRRYSSSSIACIKTTVSGFIRFCDEVDVKYPDGVTAVVTISWAQLQKLSGKKRSSLTTYYRTLKGFFKYLVSSKVIPEDPSVFVKLYGKRKKTYNFLTLRQVKLLLKGSTSQRLRNKNIIAVLYGTGLRPLELCRLSISAVNMEEHTLRIRNAKGNKQRIVPVPEGIRQTLYSYLEKRLARVQGDKEMLLFVRKGSRPLTLSIINGLIKRAARKAGLKHRVTAMTLRHTFATHLVEKGVSRTELMMLMGHEQSEQTSTYVHSSFEDLRKIADITDGVLSRTKFARSIQKERKNAESSRSE